MGYHNNTTLVEYSLIGALVSIFVFACIHYIFVNIDTTKIASSAGPPIDTQYPKGFHAVDLILEKMEFGNIAFNMPRSMVLHNTSIIQLKLGLSANIDSLKRMILEEGELEGARIRVLERMEARLSGPNFAITAITPEIQAVSQNEITDWKWEVKPTSDGLQYLHLTLSALIGIDGTTTSRAIRTFDKVIEVKVTWVQLAGAFFRANWQWLWAAILTPPLVFLWKRRKAAKAKANKSTAEELD